MGATPDGRSGDLSFEEELARLLEDPTSVGELDDDAFLSEGEPELAELAALAGALRAVPVATPDPAFRNRLRAELVAEAELIAAAAAPVVPLTDRVRERVQHWRRSASLAIASATAAMTVGGAGVAAAAQNAQPEELLYPVKLATESVRLRLADGDIETGTTRLRLAERRLSEIEEGARTLSPDTLIDTFERMDEQALLGANDLLDAYDSTGELRAMQTLGSFVREHRDRVTAILPDLPVEVVPFANRSLETVRRIEAEAGGLVLNGCVPCVDGPFDVNAPGDGSALPTTRCCTDATTGVRTEDGTAGSDTGAPTSSGSSDGGDDPATSGGDGPDPGLQLPGTNTTVDGPSVTVPSELQSPVSEATSDAGEVIEETTETVDGTVDETTDVIEQTTEPVDTTLDSTVGTTIDSADELLDPVAPGSSTLIGD